MTARSEREAKEDEEQRIFEDRCFEAWMKKVDRQISKLIGIGAYDLPDYLYRDDFDFGYSPKECAEMVVAENFRQED